MALCAPPPPPPAPAPVTPVSLKVHCGESCRRFALPAPPASHAALVASLVMRFQLPAHFTVAWIGWRLITVINNLGPTATDKELTPPPLSLSLSLQTRIRIRCYSSPTRMCAWL